MHTVEEFKHFHMYVCMVDSNIRVHTLTNSEFHFHVSVETFNPLTYTDAHLLN